MCDMDDYNGCAKCKMLTKTKSVYCFRTKSHIHALDESSWGPFETVYTGNDLFLCEVLITLYIVLGMYLICTHNQTNKTSKE